MESINKIIHYFLFLCFALESCWIGDTGIDVRYRLVGNYALITDAFDKRSGLQLALNHDIHSYQIIEKRCEVIYYDSTNIFIKHTWHDADTTHHYSRVKILTNEKVPYQKQELSYKDFYKKVESCKDCVEKRYNQSPE